MTLTLKLTSELTKRLKSEAERFGVSERKLAVQLLDRHLPPIERKRRLKALLKSIIAESKRGNPDDSIFKAIDEDRPSYRKLFPPELKGITW